MFYSPRVANIQTQFQIKAFDPKHAMPPLLVLYEPNAKQSIRLLQYTCYMQCKHVNALSCCLMSSSPSSSLVISQSYTWSEVMKFHDKIADISRNILHVEHFFYISSYLDQIRVATQNLHFGLQTDFTHWLQKFISCRLMLLKSWILTML